MIGWHTDIVISLGVGRSTIDVNLIRQDGILRCRIAGRNHDHYYDLETGLLHSSDPFGTSTGYSWETRECECKCVAWAPNVLEQFVQAAANPQVKADQLFQGLKASSVNVPNNVRFIRNYLGGVLIFQGEQRLSVGSMIDFITKGFDKE